MEADSQIPFSDRLVTAKNEKEEKLTSKCNAWTLQRKGTSLINPKMGESRGKTETPMSPVDTAATNIKITNDQLLTENTELKERIAKLESIIKALQADNNAKQETKAPKDKGL